MLCLAVTYKAEKRRKLKVFVSDMIQIRGAKAVTYSLLLCQIAGSAEHDDDSVLLQLHDAVRK